MATRTERLEVKVDVDGQEALKALAKQFEKLGGAAKKAAKVGATVAAIASAAGPAVSGLVAAGKGIAAIGAGLAKLPPLAATLPALAAGFALVVGTIKMGGPAIGKALTPIAEAFKSIQGRVGDLASKQLPGIAREFNRVNFPTISRAMQAIAKDLNTVVVSTGRWVNSASGQDAIRRITEATAAATDKLDGRLARVAMALGEVTKRVGAGAIGFAADQMVRLSEATIRWLDSVDQSDIDEAAKALAGWGSKLKDTFVALRDVGKWMADNEGRVKQFSDAVATAAIVIGAATGNWVAVLAGSTSLAINHWEDLKKAFADDGPIRSTFEKLASDPKIRGIWESMKTAWQGAVDSFKKGTADIGPKVTEMFAAWKKAWDEWAPLIKAWWDGIGKPVFSAIGTVVAQNLQIFIAFMTDAGRALDLLGEGLKLLWRIFSEVVGNIVNGAATAFGWIPGLGPKLEAAAKNFNAFRDRVNAALDGIEDEIVNVTYRQQGRAVQGSSVFQSGIGGYAAGTPSARPGLAWVGEGGRPELVNFRGGERVYDAQTSARMASGAGSGPVTLHATGDTNSWLMQAVMNGLRTSQLVMKVGNQRVQAG